VFIKKINVKKIKGGNKMNFLQKGYKRIISVMVTASLLVSIIFIPMNAGAENKTERFVNDGVNYEMTSTVQMETKIIELINLDTNDKYVLKDDGYTIEVKSYDYEGRDFFGNQKFNVKENKMSIDKIQKQLDENEVRAQAYASKTKIMVPTANGNYYWYMTGKSGKDLGYSKFGCVSTYKVRNKSAGVYLNNYTDAIDSSNKSFWKAGGSTLASATIVAVFLLFASGVGAPVALFMLGGSYALDGAAIKCLYDAYTKYKAAAKWFNYVKEYAL
jgi:hypothetical protein